MSEPRTVWVTGAASGMGASHAHRFGALGDRVACWDRNADGVESVAAEIRASGGDALPLTCDLSDWEEVAAAAVKAEHSLGPPSIVVANAGIILSGESIEDLDPDEWRRVVDVNLTGAFHTAKAAVPQLRRAAPAALIMIASICGLTTSAGFGAYNASKHGVIGLMRTLANELGPDDITVNAICPGWVRTPMLDASIADADAEGSDLGEFTSMSIVERLVEPEEVTDAVIWLASPGARMITGVALPIDGGLMEKRAWP
jgi:NAD(P)-dependent dehydrogenase (short-subunit alcohol dehydrogenase family)